jgi:trans-2,3-dihydro-3-hydroxyanthranilate isomerase
MRRSYVVYDVFTQDALSGNPLAVVFDAEGLDGARMQAITRELNLSETVFVLAPDNANHAAKLRIFTPGRELPFAGHPTVGTAIALFDRGEGASGHMVLEEGIGPVSCRVEKQAAGASYASFILPSLSVPLDLTLDADRVAGALGLSSADIGFGDHRLSVWSAGVPFLMVPVASRAAVGRVTFDLGAWQAMAPVIHGNSVSAYVYCEGGDLVGSQFHARMFSPSMGIAEDPATGAAIAAMTGAIYAFEALGEGRHALQIEQGVEMGRPSLIFVQLETSTSAILSATIGGHAVKVASGMLDL